MSITIYSKDNCPHCIRAMKLLEDAGFNYDVLKVGTDVDRLTVLEKFPGVRMVPIIVIGGHHIEGISELETLIQNKQLEALL